MKKIWDARYHAEYLPWVISFVSEKNFMRHTLVSWFPKIDWWNLKLLAQGHTAPVWLQGRYPGQITGFHAVACCLLPLFLLYSWAFQFVHEALTETPFPSLTSTNDITFCLDSWLSRIGLSRTHHPVYNAPYRSMLSQNNYHYVFIHVDLWLTSLCIHILPSIKSCGSVTSLRWSNSIFHLI